MTIIDGGGRVGDEDGQSEVGDGTDGLCSNHVCSIDPAGVPVHLWILIGTCDTMSALVLALAFFKKKKKLAFLCLC